MPGEFRANIHLVEQLHHKARREKNRHKSSKAMDLKVAE
jgi:hypothetical protein